MTLENEKLIVIISLNFCGQHCSLPLAIFNMRTYFVCKCDREILIAGSIRVPIPTTTPMTNDQYVWHTQKQHKFKKNKWNMGINEF